MTTPNLLHIFKPGTQTAMNGMTLEFSAADLAASAQAYDPAKHEAPIVIGHPKHDDPAYGWVNALTTDAAGLHAEQRQVDASFAELVAAGRYKKISASFYLPDAPNNPVPGVYYLRHVGFLGAQPPAVKGLKQASFADAEQGVIEFGDWGMDTTASMWRSLREWILGKFGREAADQATPDWQIEAIREAARQDDDARAAFADPAPSTVQTPAGVPPAKPTKEKQVTEAEQAALAAENATLKRQLATAEAEKKASAAAKRSGEHLAYAEQLVAAGTLAPKDMATVAAVLDFADADTVIEFGEGAARQPLATAFKAFLAGLPKVVEFGETARKGKAVDGDHGTGTAEFAEKNVDPGRMALHNRATALAAEKNIPYEQAVRQLL